MSGLDKWLPPLESGAGIAAFAAIAGFLKRVRHRRRFGRIEDEKLVTELVEKAVATQGEVLDDLREERVEDRRHIDRLAGELVGRDRMIAGLRARLDKLERQVAGLSRENGRLTGELVRVRREVESGGPSDPPGTIAD